MNPNNNAIIIYDNKLGKFVDKCDDIQAIKDNGALFDVAFNNGKTFSYSRQKVRWITSPREIQIDDKFLFVKGSLVFSVAKILQFDDWFKEVDGRQHNEPVQKARDERKDRLLTAAGIKVLRLPTTTIECREQIEEALRWQNGM